MSKGAKSGLGIADTVGAADPRVYVAVYLGQKKRANLLKGLRPGADSAWRHQL
jgi:hypothetical protein